MEKGVQESLICVVIFFPPWNTFITFTPKLKSLLDISSLAYFPPFNNAFIITLMRLLELIHQQHF